MKRRSDEEISAPLYEYDAAVRAQYGCFAGVDEAGRGPPVRPGLRSGLHPGPGEPGAGYQRFQKAHREKAGRPVR